MDSEEKGNDEKCPADPCTNIYALFYPLRRGREGGDRDTKRGEQICSYILKIYITSK